MAGFARISVIPDEQLRGDLRVGAARAGQAGDQRLLRGQHVGCPGGAFERLRAGRAQLDPRPFGERLHAEAAEHFVGAAQLVPGVTDTPLAAQPLPVQQIGAAEFHAQRGAAEVVDGLPVAGLGSLAFADQRARASLDATCPVGATGSCRIRQLLQCLGGGCHVASPGGGLDELSQAPVAERQIAGIGAAQPCCRERVVVAAQAAACADHAVPV
jgi:hypothetical protein